MLVLHAECLTVSRYLSHKENSSYTLNSWNTGNEKIIGIHASEREVFV